VSRERYYIRWIRAQKTLKIAVRWTPATSAVQFR